MNSVRRSRRRFQLVLRYILALVAGAVAFLIVAFLQAVLIGQMLNGIRRPGYSESIIPYLGQFAIPVAAGILCFIRDGTALR